MFARLDAFAGRFYLAAICASEHPTLAPEHLSARWYHMLWLLLPIAGIIGFIAQVEHSHQNRSTRP